ncbi:CorA family divalent cation transporter [Neobacillus dielmonensis]|uniref:CorA family divalent cation transporter n=1 Tax=Neobacillus dielmonensis TaxID=1347369 RepID=UPI0005AB0797|nr:CorA family divalent cation transporter [Neobacillus dielmonensis]
MTHPTVVNEKSYLIVPFAYNLKYKQAVSAIDFEFFERVQIRTERLFDHIEKLVAIGEDTPESIGSHFRMKQKARTVYNLPNKNDLMLTCKTKQNEYQFSVNTVDLYLFETQVGFWCIQLGYPDGITIEKLIETNYYAKKLSQFEYELSFEKKISKNEIIKQPVDLGAIINELSNPFQVTTFFEGIKNNPSQALVYTSAKIDEISVEESSLASYLFQLRRSFKSTYKPSKLEEDFIGNQGLLPLFHNSYWGISLEGLANIVTKTEDPKTEQFFTSTYFHQIETTYLYLYILGLHQKYALLRFTYLASKLSYEIDSFNKDYSQQNSLISELRNQIIRFMLRSSYTQVSNNTHYAQLYEVVRQNLRINDLFKELHDELSAISSITQVEEQKQQNELEKIRREQSEKFNNRITAITTFFLPITVITGFFGMNLAFISKNDDKWWLFALSTILVYLFTYWKKKD